MQTCQHPSFFRHAATVRIVPEEAGWCQSSGNIVLHKFEDTQFDQSDGSLSTSIDACLEFDFVGSFGFSQGHLSD